MKYVVLDFETASQCDLNKKGAWIYAQDFSTFLLCLGYKVVADNRPTPTVVLTERQIQALDPALMALVVDPDVMFVAHNASFEQAIWKFQMEPMGWPPLPPERWHDTMAVAAMKALPLGLDKLTQALELQIRKDMDGHRLMMKMCKPNHKGEWEHSPENMKRLYQYNIGDCDSQYASHVVLKGLGPDERKVWILDQKINQRGLLIDKKFIAACQDVLEQVRGPMTARFREITGGINPTQREKILNWVNEQGVTLDDMRKPTLDALLNQDSGMDWDDFSEPLPLLVHEAINLRRALASSSVAKLQRMLDCAANDGRIRYTMQYHGARTGRVAGRLIQIQNFPRGTIQERQGMTPEFLAELIESRDVPRIRECWGDDIFDAVISSLRSCIVSGKGKTLVAGDYSQVEARVAWALAGQHDRAEQLHSGVDTYCEMGALIFGRAITKADSRERHIGKSAVLGLQFGLGAVGFRNKMAPKETMELALHTVNTYRKEFAPLIPKFWYGLAEASTKAVWCAEAREYDFGGVAFRRKGDFLTMRLPSGRLIYYHKPQKYMGFWPSGDERPGWTAISYQGGKARRKEMWYGELMNNLVQGTARDIMIHAMFTCENEGLPLVFTVHDELVCEVEDRPDLALALKQIMEDIPDWARERKFLISAECGTMQRYRK